MSFVIIKTFGATHANFVSCMSLLKLQRITTSLLLKAKNKATLQEGLFRLYNRNVWLYI